MHLVLMSGRHKLVKKNFAATFNGIIYHWFLFCSVINSYQSLGKNARNRNDSETLNGRLPSSTMPFKTQPNRKVRMLS